MRLSASIKSKATTHPIFSACGCDEQGSDGCDAFGVCSCKTNVHGDKCTECIDTLPYNFPDCTGK